MFDRNPIRVLLVDDHRAILSGLSSLISGEAPRMKVAGAAASGAEALRLNREVQPDVILLDVNLGEENGLDLMPALAAVSTARIVILTSLADPAVRERALQLGASGFVMKDDTAAALLESIENAILCAGEVGAGHLSRPPGSTFPAKEGGSSDLPPRQRDYDGLA